MKSEIGHACLKSYTAVDSHIRGNEAMVLHRIRSMNEENGALTMSYSAK